MEQWTIKDIPAFTNAVRNLVFKNFGENKKDVEDFISCEEIGDKAELDKLLSYQESYLIIKESIKEILDEDTGENQWLVNDKILLNICESLTTRMVDNILNSLVNQGVLESSYDSEANDFLFWTKEKEEK